MTADKLGFDKALGELREMAGKAQRERDAQETLKLHAQREAQTLREKCAALERMMDSVVEGYEFQSRRAADAEVALSAVTVAAAARDAEVVSALEAARKRVGALEHALCDFAEHGTRHDLNPSLSWDSEQGLAFAFTRYIKRMDEHVRECARRALDGHNQREAEIVSEVLSTSPWSNAKPDGA